MTPEEHRERHVFSYEFRGVKRFADPAAVRSVLIRASAGAFNELCVAASKDGTEAGDAREKLHAVLCSAFGLPPFDPATGEGTTEGESASLYDRFAAWLDRPKADEPAEAPPSA
jgi:hypothetical protein